MFTNISAIITGMSLLTIIIVMTIRLFKTRKGDDKLNKLDEIIKILQTKVLDTLKDDSKLKLIEKDQGREAVLKIILSRVQTVINSTNLLTETEKFLLKNINLANLILHELVKLGVLTDISTTPIEGGTIADKISEVVIDATNKLSTGGKDAENLLESTVKTVIQSVGVPKPIVDKIISPIVETLITDKTIKPAKAKKTTARKAGT